MKLKLLIAFFAVALASCSHDSRNFNPIDEDPDNGNTNGDAMNRIVQTDFNEDGSVKVTTRTEFDENNKALHIFEHDGSGALTSTTDYTYNKDGQVETMAYFTAADGDLPVNTYSITYDGSGKIANLSETTASVNSSTDFVYNPDNTITAAKTISGGTLEVTKYFLSSAGLVYKKTSTSSNEEIIYNGENIQTYTTATVTSTYTYDAEHELRGQQQAVAANQFKGNMVNTIIVNGFQSIALGKTKYVLQKLDDNGDRYDYTYQFDDNGYPVKVRCFKNQSATPFFIREVSYK